MKTNKDNKNQLGDIIQLPIDFKIPHNVDYEKFIEKIYNLVVDMAEEENIEVVSDNWIAIIEENIEL